MKSRALVVAPCLLAALAAAGCDPAGRGLVVEPVPEPQLARTVHPTRDACWSPALGPAASGNFHCVAVADFDGDGHPDIAAGGFDWRGIRVWLANGDGTWTSIDGPRYLGLPTGIAAADVNGDGRPDIVVAGKGEVPGVRVYLNTEEIVWKEGEPATITQNYSNVKLADVNGDGYPDIIASREREGGSGGIAVWLNLKGKGWSADVGPKSSDGYNDVIVADFNPTTDAEGKNVGHLDLAGARWGNPGGIDIWYGNGLGAWSRAHEDPAIKMNYQGIHVGDFNGDGQLDVVAAAYRSDTGVVIFLSNRQAGDRETGWWTTPIVLAGKGSFWSVRAVDLNADGLLDVVATSFDGRGVRAWLQLPGTKPGGIPRFLEQSYRLPHKGTYYSAEVGDFNRDSKPDIVAGSADEGVKVWFQTDEKGAIKPSPHPRKIAVSEKSPRLIGEVDEVTHDPDENMVFINITRLDGRKYSEYRIGEGDRLRIEVYPGRVAEPIVFTKQVEASGELLIPLVSSQPMRIVDKDGKGLSPTQLRDLITQKLKDTFKEPSVTVAVELPVARKASVLGEIRMKPNQTLTGPGQYVLFGKTRVLEFIALHGGFTERADLSKVEVRNRNGEKRVVDLFKAVFQSKLSQDVLLDDADVITIPSTAMSDRKVYVLGEVGRPGVYGLQDNVRLIEAVQIASSFTGRANRRQIIVIRGDKNKPDFFQVNIQQMLETGDLSKNMLLEDGDVVFVPKDWIGNIQEFYAWFLPGFMRTVGR